MKGVLCKAFALHPGEGNKALLFALLAFLWSIATTAGLKYADALVLLHLGSATLPKIYTYTSCGMIILSTCFIYLYYRFSVTKVYLFLVSFGILFYSFIAFSLSIYTGPKPDWIWFSFRIFAAIFHYNMITAFWNFTDQFHSLSDSKRLFGLFASMIFLGNTVTSFMMQSGLVSISQLMLTIIVLLTVVSLWIVSIIQIQEKQDNSFEHTEELPTFSIKKIYDTVFSSPYTRLIVLANFFSFLLWVISEYNYMSTFESHFSGLSPTQIGGEESTELTLFLGKGFLITCLINLIFGLFIYGRMVRRFGLSTMIFITPILYFISFSGWMIYDSLLFPLLGLFIVEGTAEITEDSNFNLLLNTGPHKI